VGLSACDKEVTAPVSREPSVRGPSYSISSGLTAYTDRTVWEAAVTAASSSAQFFVFAGQTLGRVTVLDTDYNTFHLTVDRLSSNSSNNPGIAILPDAGCSLDTGDCNEFIFNMQDPSYLAGDMPQINSVVFPQNIIAFGGYFGQVGYGGGTSTVTGPVTMHFGTETVTINDYMGTNGYGFFGVVSTVPSNTVSFTYVKAGTIVNDLVELYNPAYAFAPAAPPPPDDKTVEEQIDDLLAYLASIDMLKGKAKPYEDRIEHVQKEYAKGKTKQACNELKHFMKKVDKKTNKEISAEDADALLGMAGDLAEAIGCDGGPPV
jgi:hypothetical protein